MTMNEDITASVKNSESIKDRPPFNEVSVLFPLLSIYTAGYLGLMIADFFLKLPWIYPTAS